MYELGKLFQLFVGLVLLVGFFYIIIKITVKIARGDVLRAIKANKERAGQLEHDYRWRRIKVAYVAVSAVGVALSVGVAYNSTVHETVWGTLTKPSMERGYMALIVGVVVAWIGYKLLLPRLYTYLKNPAK